MNTPPTRTAREALASFPAPISGPTETEKVKAEIILGCSELLASSIDALRLSLETSAKANDMLSKRVYYLNVVLTVATVLGTVVAVLALFCHQ